MTEKDEQGNDANELQYGRVKIGGTHWEDHWKDADEINKYPVDLKLMDGSVIEVVDEEMHRLLAENRRTSDG